MYKNDLLEYIDSLLTQRSDGNIGLLRVRQYVEDNMKTGKWIMHDEIKNVYGGVCIECSECGEKYVVQYVEDEKFCRNCGAEMKGEEDA